MNLKELNINNAISNVLTKGYEIEGVVVHPEFIVISN